MTTQAAPLPPPAPAGWIVLGRPFVSVGVDYALVGGVFGLLLGCAAYGAGFRFDTKRFWALVLCTSYAHFAASTVRLYARPGAVRRWPFLTVGVPLITLAATSALLFTNPATWRWVEGFYLTWSCYHYAAQTFGLAVMYAYRSGCRLQPRDRSLLRAACLLPFVYGVLASRSGLSNVIPEAVYAQGPFGAARETIRRVLLPLLVLAPVAVFVHVRRARGQALPLISLVLMLVNAVFWSFFLDRDAFAWAALAHALQYLVIVTVFHVKDTMAAPDNAHGSLYHTIGFYAACLGLGYALFELWPAAYGAVWINLDRPSTGLHIAFIINIHHFLVDGYIWKLRDDKNLAHVVAPTPAVA